MPILDGMVVAYVNNPPTFGNDGLFTAFNRWAGKENVPTLVHIVSKIRSTVWDNVYRHNAMRALGRLKDPRGAEVLAKKLDDFFDRGVASEALAELGAGAEKAVVPFLNHPGPFGTREAARKLLKGYNTRDDLLLTQCLIDLDSTEGERKTAAVQWIALTNVDAKRRPEIARGLNKAIQNEGSLRNQDLRTAIEKWATTDTVGKLIQILDQEKLGGHETIRLLGKLGDANGVKAIARQVGNFFNGNEAKAALKNAGPRAEPAVVEVMTTTQDGRVRTECARFLGEIGTRGSIQALTFTAQRFAQDVQLRNAAQQSIAAINGRGK
jgi:HEAT repeat protein